MDLVSFSIKHGCHRKFEIFAYSNVDLNFFAYSNVDQEVVGRRADAIKKKKKKCVYRWKDEEMFESCQVWERRKPV